MMAAPNLRAARTSLPIPKARATRGYQPLGSCSRVLGTVLSRPDVALRLGMEPISQLPLPKHKEGAGPYRCRESPALGYRRAVREM